MSATSVAPRLGEQPGREAPAGGCVRGGPRPWLGLTSLVGFGIALLLARGCATAHAALAARILGPSPRAEVHVRRGALEQRAADDPNNRAEEEDR